LELIEHRYARLGMIITSNRPFSDWEQTFPDANMIVAAIYRLIHHATTVEIEANNYCMKEAQSRSTSVVGA